MLVDQTPRAARSAASMASPVRARSAVRWRPMRRGRLTVPPAPGIRPRDTSGRPKVASALATTRPANAGSSTPDPRQAPCDVRGHAVGDRVDGAPALWSIRTRCAVAGSGREPNSSRSPPAQNAGPSPREVDLRDRVVDRGELERVDELVAHRGVEGVADLGAGQGDVQRVSVALDAARASPVVDPLARRARRPPGVRTPGRPAAPSTRPTRRAGPRRPTGSPAPRSSVGERRRGERVGVHRGLDGVERRRSRRPRPRRTSGGRRARRAGGHPHDHARPPRGQRWQRRPPARRARPGPRAGGQAGQGGSPPERAAATRSLRETGWGAMGRAAGRRAIIVAPCSP